MEINTEFTAPYYSRNNLELILGSNRRTLDYRISALINKGVLERIRHGFYLNTRLLSITTEKEAFLEYVGTVAKYPSYVSLEYALSTYGLIPESIFAITYITSKKPGMYSSKNISLKYRNIKPALFNGYETRTYGAGVYLYAKKYKALFDFIYLTPTPNQNTLKEILLNSRINWNSLSSVDRESFVDVCDKSGSRKMANAVIILQKENIL